MEMGDDGIMLGLRREVALVTDEDGARLGSRRMMSALCYEPDEHGKPRTRNAYGYRSQSRIAVNEILSKSLNLNDCRSRPHVRWI